MSFFRALVSSPSAVLGAEPASPIAALAPHELAQMSAIRSAGARAAHNAAHVLVRQAAAQWRGGDWRELALVQRCATCGGTRGLAFTAGNAVPRVCLAHTDAAVAAVASESACAIDIEDWLTRAHAYAFS